MLPSLLPNPQVAEIRLWIPVSSLPSSGKEAPSDHHWAQMLLPSSPVKSWAHTQSFCGTALWMFSIPISLSSCIFYQTHLLWPGKTDYFKFPTKRQRKKWLHFNSDITKTLPGSATVDTANTKPIFLQQS